MTWRRGKDGDARAVEVPRLDVARAGPNVVPESPEPFLGYQARTPFELPEPLRKKTRGSLSGA
ncbi:MAG: hypothetical protein ACRENE_08300, partial [Polyangiaceae bacterium]